MYKKLKKLSVSFKKKSTPKINYFSRKRKEYYSKFLGHAQKRPVATFLGLLLMLLGLIIISNVINKPKPEAEETSLPTKEVETYTIGQSPKITVQAQVEKSGVIRVVSLGAGVVQSINVEVGQDVGAGTNLIGMSTNYQGGNAFSVQRQLAGVQYKNAKDTYQINVELIDKQKELAEKSDQNADELRNISNQSLESTRSIIALNNEILTSLEAQQSSLEAQNIGGSKEAEILGVKQLRSQLMSGNSQLEAGLRASEYTGASDKIPAELSNISKDIALKQLEIQKKAVGLNLEVSRLSLVLAQINEALMFPASPVNGTVERIFVREGQVLSPGMPIAQITGASDSLIAVAFLNREIAQGVGRASASTLHLGNESLESVPFYVSKDATDGSLYTAQYAIPQELASQVTDRGYITIEIPVDFPNTGSVIPFVPIDSVFQTQDQAYLFIVKNGKAESKKVKLGQVIGRFVEVTSGLSESDQVILNRNVIAGDPVKPIN